MTEYKNPLLDAMIDIKSGNFLKRNQQYLFPIMRWNSGNDKHGNMMNFESSFYINKYIFIVPYKMVMSYMYFSYKMHKNWKTKQHCLFLKYPKKSKEIKTLKRDVIVKYLKQIYNWTENECKKNTQLIDSYIEDNKFIDWLDSYVGFEKKEKKLFKIKCNLKVKKKVNKDIVTVNSTKSLLDF